MAKRVGRPKKSEVEAKKPGNRGQVGRPKGDAAIINEYKSRMLASPKSKKVLEKIFDAALDDDHKGQQAAWKLIADRILPVSYFEKDKNNDSKPQVNITISGVGGDVSVNEDKEDDVIDVTPIEVKDAEE